MTNSKLNQKNYNIWSEFYDQYPNPTVAIDELKFPSMYSEIENQNVLEIFADQKKSSGDFKSNCLRALVVRD